MNLEETGSVTAAPRQDERVRHVAAWRRLMSRPELGVHQASVVLRLVARARGLGVILISHNVRHAYPVGDVFTLLNRGRSMGTFRSRKVAT